jgi:hypothetical protein
MPLFWNSILDYQNNRQTSKLRLDVCRPELLFRFPMRLVLPAVRAELLQLNPLCRRSLVLRLAIVPVLAFTALKLNDFTWHLA